MSLRTLLVTSKHSFPLLEEYCRKNDIQLSQQSFISIEFTPFTLPEDTAWLFFSSKNAVKAYFAQYKDTKAKIACITPGTASALPENVQADFIGEYSDGPDKIAHAFFDEIDESTPVAHVTSDKTVHLLTRNSDSHTIHEITGYKTVLTHPAEPLEQDSIICTSPSNFDAIKGKITAKTIIAMGPTTAKHVANSNFEGDIIESPQPNEQGWVSALEQI